MYTPEHAVDKWEASKNIQLPDIRSSTDLHATLQDNQLAYCLLLNYSAVLNQSIVARHLGALAAKALAIPPAPDLQLICYLLCALISGHSTEPPVTLWQ